MSDPRKYRKMPVVIEAMRYQDNAAATAIIDWALSCGATINYWCASSELCRRGTDEHVLRIATLEGNMDASIGDWIIKGVSGEFYPCKPDIFTKTYEAA